MSFLSKIVKHGRIKPRYNAVPTDRERRYHIWLIENFPCGCGCGGDSTVVHHPLECHPDQRWRRDHEFVVQMKARCHMELHACGDETKFVPGVSFAETASRNRQYGKQEGLI